MSVRSAQAITVEFTTSRFDTGAATNADSLPTGTLVKNGTDDAASVTVTNIDAGRYKAAVTLPTLAIGDIVELSIAATVNSVAGKGIIWRDTKDVLLDSSGLVTVPDTQKVDLNTVKTQTITCSAGITVNPNVGTTQPVNFHGTGATAYVKTDLYEVLDTAASPGTVDANVVSASAAGKTAIEDAVWDAAVSSHTTLNTFGDDHQFIADTNNRMVRLEQGIVVATGTVTDLAGSPTSFTTDLTQVTNAFKDKTIVFTSGACNKQSQVILSYNNTGGQVTVSEPFTAAPANGDTFEVLALHVHPVSQIVTGIMQDTTSGNYTVVGSFGKGLFTSGNAPGAAGGMSIVGSAMTLTAAYDAAKTASQAGDAMALTAAALDAILIESGITAGATLTDDSGTQLTSINARQALALALSALAGVLAGAATTDITTKPVGNSGGNTRIDATVDSSGNRSALTLKVPT